MFKLLLISTCLISVAFSAPHRPTGDEYRAELVAAGLSTSAVDGIMKISEEAYISFSKYGKTPNFQDAIEAVTKLMFNLEDFIKTQSKEDQTKYAAYCEKKKEEYRH
ncbi:hypothetical protein CRE_08700 [Caenorhabditis remanei]|uniref:Uncharacterized protein n=1 Tax=Caenorhabditis remanei TaxID=31234 RepID=E3LJF0_CAERE|nr:hypothetical protein CRE_08700 [Caenorhabditis remanei]